MEKKKIRIIDLAQEIYEGQPVFPPHHKTYIFQHTTFEETKRKGFRLPFQTRNLLMSEHGPTHTDADAEVNPNGKTIDQEPLEKFYTSAICLDVSRVPPKGFINKAILQEALDKAGLDIREGDTVLLYTGHYDRTKDDPTRYLNENPGLDMGAALWLADKGVVNVGIDASSVDNPDDPDFSVHAVCRDRPTMTNTEHLANLDKVAGKRFTYVGLPLKIRGGTASPIRPAAILEEEE
ncbi:MAG: cyclase family protein [Candidatus Geothermarchaeales archaeon]